MGALLLIVAACSLVLALLAWLADHFGDPMSWFDHADD